MNIDQLLTAAEPWIVEALVALLTWIGGAALLALRRYAGERAALIASQALSEVLQRGIATAIADRAPDVAGAAAEYAQKLSPDLVKRTGADGPRLIERAAAEMAVRGLR